MSSAKRRQVNNDFYDELGDRWHDDDRHAIALLRAESAVRAEYVGRRTRKGDRIADIGAGAGFLALPLHESGRDVMMVDFSLSSLRAASRRADAGRSNAAAAGPVAVQGDAFALPIENSSFDVALLMDVLEHVDRPAEMIREAARTLRPGGRLFFHTFNRTFAARLLAIHGMRIIVPECPDDLHVYSFFITPDELESYCAAAGLEVREITGLRPRLLTWAAVRSLLTRRLDPGFSFTLTESTAVGYLGYAEKK